jgi:hypothetical protein
VYCARYVRVPCLELSVSLLLRNVVGAGRRRFLSSRETCDSFSGLLGIKSNECYLIIMVTTFHIKLQIKKCNLVLSSSDVKPRRSENTCLTLSITNPTRSDLGSNPGLRSGKPAANRLRYGTTLFVVKHEGIRYLLISRKGLVSHKFPTNFRTVLTDTEIFVYTGCFKKSCTTLRSYINVFREQVQCFELSQFRKTHRVLPWIVTVQCDFHW